MDEKAARSIYDRLAAPFPEEAIQRTRAVNTKKGYDTTGVSYQFIVNRLNEVAGLHGWNYSYEILKTFEGSYQNGVPFFDFTLEVSMWVGDTSLVRKAPGGHRSATYADALKGALTNGLKKVAAMFGLGRQAYEGTLDDDNLPHPQGQEDGHLKEIPKPVNVNAAAIIDEPQRKHLFPLCKENHVVYEDLKQFLQKNYKLEHSKDILAKDYKAICKWIQNGGMSDEERLAAEADEEAEGLSN